MNEKTRNWLLNQGGVVTVYPLFVSKPFKNKQMLLDFQCYLAEPMNKDDYYLIEEKGIKMYVSRKIEVKKEKITFWVRGYPSLEQLDVKGLKRFSRVQ